MKKAEEYWLDVADKVQNPREAFYCGAIATAVVIEKIMELTGDDAIRALNEWRAQLTDAIVAMERDYDEPH